MQLVFLEEYITALLFNGGLPPCCGFDQWQMMEAGNKGPQSALSNTAWEGRTSTAWNIYTGLEERYLKQGQQDVSTSPNSA